jgi:UDP-glucose 4-epimerase
LRVLVTGGAGYIGSVVTEDLVARGHEVVVYDNLVKGHRETVREPARFVLGDLLDTQGLATVLADHAIEAVVHMAADSLVGESVQDPAKYYRNNVQAGLSLLDAMRSRGVQRLVFSSTAAVYGEPAKQPIEEHDPTNPTNPYGETKLAFERALRWYNSAYGLRFVSLRYFNAAGASELNGELHDPETHLIPLVLRAAAGGSPVTIFGDDYPTPDGTCIRDYIHVQDLACAHSLALEALAGAGPVASVYNLGCGGAGYSVREVIDAAQQVTGRPVRFTVGPRRPGDPSVLVASSRRIAQALGWSPERQDLRMIVESAWRWQERRARGGP